MPNGTDRYCRECGFQIQLLEDWYREHKPSRADMWQSLKRPEPDMFITSDADLEPTTHTNGHQRSALAVKDVIEVEPETVPALVGCGQLAGAAHRHRSLEEQQAALRNMPGWDVPPTHCPACGATAPAHLGNCPGRKPNAA